MAQQWYWMQGNEKQGPVNTAGLKALARNGQLKPTDTRQPGLEHLDLELEEPDVRVALGRPRLLKQHQQRREPLWEHRFALFHAERKSSICSGPTFWTTAKSDATPRPVASPSPCRAFITRSAHFVVAKDFRVGL
jgi:hypothetical protein